MKIGAARPSHLGVRRRLVGAVSAGVVAATVVFTPTAPALAGVQEAPRAAGVAPTPHTADVMTRNLYLGAPLDDMITALSTGTPLDVLTQATKTWNTVKDSDPAERMAAVADEIAEARPAVVGLQEVTTWSTYPYDPATQQVSGGPTVAYDFLDLLLDALADRGVEYHAVRGATSQNFTPPPIPLLPGLEGAMAVQLADRDVILRRDGVEARNGQHGNFKTILSIPQRTGEALPVDRGWGSADVRTNRTTFRFVNAHTEAWGPEELRKAQVRELFLAQARIAALTRVLPTVYVGDYNSAAPAADAYKLLDSVLDDAWGEANGSAPGYTCCQAGDLTNQESQLRERIDLVMTSPAIKARSSYRTGTTSVDLPGASSWASDHAGVVARLFVK